MGKEETVQEIIEGFSRLQRPSGHAAWRVLGLSRAQISMLHMIYCHENISPKQVASHLGITQSAVAQLLDPLIKKDFVARQTDPKDRRAVKLAVTAKGKSLLKKFRRQRTEGLRSALNRLDQSELAKLVAIYRKMTPGIK